MLPEHPLDPFSAWICSECDFSIDVQVAERKVAQVKKSAFFFQCKIKIATFLKNFQIEDELAEISTRQDMKRIKEFILHYSGKILHPNHYLLLIAKRNYLFISRKQMIELLAKCDSKEIKSALQLSFKKKTEPVSYTHLTLPTIYSV